MLSPEQMKRIRRHRIELILLGVALAKPGDRELVLDSVLMCDLRSDLVNDCLDAIREQDGSKLLPILRNWGVHEPKISSIVPSLINTVRRAGDQERAKNVLKRALSMSDVEELKQTLESALVELCSLDGEDV